MWGPVRATRRVFDSEDSCPTVSVDCVFLGLRFVFLFAERQGHTEVTAGLTKKQRRGAGQALTLGLSVGVAGSVGTGRSTSTPPGPWARTC